MIAPHELKNKAFNKAVRGYVISEVDDYIDFLIDNTRKTVDDLHPKGIQEKTMRMILDHLRENTNKWLTGDEIAEKVGLTGVTVRRYMTHLTETGLVMGDMNYETGGRPCMLYKISK